MGGSARWARVGAIPSSKYAYCHQVRLHTQEEITALLGRFLAVPSGEAQLGGQGLGFLLVMVGEDAVLDGTAGGAGNGTAHVAGPDEPEGIVHS